MRRPVWLGLGEMPAFLEAQRRKGCRERSVQADRAALQVFYGWWKQSGQPGDRIAGPMLDAYRLWLADQRGRYGRKLAPATQLAKLSPLRSFLRFLQANEALSAGVADLVLLPRVERPMRQVLSEDELVALCRAVAGREPTSLRDRALLELLVATAMRPSEAAALVRSDVDLSHARVRIRRGKGDRLRWLPLTHAAVRALRAYLARGRRALLCGRRSEVLFVAPRTARLGGDAWGAIVASAAAAAGLHGVTAYTIRHSVATAMARAGVELRHLQALLGHEWLKATEVYLHLGPQDLKLAHRRAHPRERNRREPRGGRTR